MKTRRTQLSAALSPSLACAAGAVHGQGTIRAIIDTGFAPMDFVMDGKRAGFGIKLVKALAGAGPKAAA
ncbi:hypothetical protein N7373_21385 [Achromobacter mucicolens]|uniref:hypothetical protein n=1 Tax=Achromobacter mucicolens TaxID=1389922 RepID=UPI00244A9FCB|nr:hypothetical protein [Achromobacter mucicolens]MDH0094006.1 hypothetical protein [Achromobacter mucicolens]